MRLLLGLLLALPALAQFLGFPGPAVPFAQGGGACTTPNGTNFTESFGDASTSCWSGGPATCTGTWTVGAGTAHSIITSPGTPPANKACAYSLNMNVPGTLPAPYLSKTFTGIAGAFDLTGTIYIGTAPAVGTVQVAVCIVASSGDCDSGAIAALVIDNQVNGSALGLRAMGATNSAVVTAGVGWHTFTIHRDATAASSYLSVDGGTNNTFTTNNGTAARIYVGPQHYAYGTANWSIGNLAF